MNKKIIFLDIDGTLVDDDGMIPESAKTACIEARKNGHLIYLCTGRSKAEIYDFIMEIGFDGIIGAGGGFVEIEGEMLYHHKVSDEDVRHMVDYFDEHDLDFYLESNGGLFASKNFLPHVERLIYGDVDNDPVAREKKEQRPHPFITGLTIGEDNLYRSDVNKACFLENKNVPFEQIKKEFAGKFEVIQCTVSAFGQDSGELMVPGIHKAVAIEKLIEHLGRSQEDTIAIGDGMNDAEMIEYCALGIAMGNAKPGLKAIADDITDAVDEDGLFHSFKKHSLI
ncbi:MULTISPECIES: Cof-type HAD-IIB family hydrolase [Paenibacillus]|uniref:Hydrolase n=1 Tax=Paenibacillus polymyxa (strain SC2) TaxID=886882 RepID=E3EEC3_PAEPS|nr:MULTISPECIES: Cof-type HAD-IIB family hydrolase [Paenibacillus]ADO55046.1 hydrolase [Paenibacillus polymyxa SC2]AJE50777.1 hydrolase [Paenibacillus polymyxa]AUO05543.1 Cof-type HAD-IIB family hydrolase [Paenibacillus sp. lzh-N1]KAF6565814.1 Cof-type HAD-IIB family hydrolase [Paenibacillus sp. EKM202P]KAF6572509.1 Cof-type HAD-IIB family hydrolase [Paenibacillus sp. EKM207P]